MAIYCETCGEEVESENLNFNDVHDKCGTDNNYEISDTNKEAFGK